MLRVFDLYFPVRRKLLVVRGVACLRVWMRRVSHAVEEAGAYMYTMQPTSEQQAADNGWRSVLSIVCCDRARRAQWFSVRACKVSPAWTST